MSKNKHNEQHGSAVERSDERIKQTGEVFTPMELCYEMVDEIPEDILSDSTSTFLDNSCGSGNFLVALKDRLVNKYNHPEEHVINNMLYAVEMQEDNLREACERVGVEYPHPHYVCADALEYDYSFGTTNALEDLL